MKTLHEEWDGGIESRFTVFTCDRYAQSLRSQRISPYPPQQRIAAFRAGCRVEARREGRRVGAPQPRPSVRAYLVYSS